MKNQRDDEMVKAVIADLESLAERLTEHDEWAPTRERLAVHFAIGYLSVRP